MTEQPPQLQQCQLPQPAPHEEAPAASGSDPDLLEQGLEAGSGSELWPSFNIRFDDLDFSDCHHDFSDGIFHEQHDPDVELETLPTQQVLLVQHWEGYNLALEISVGKRNLGQHLSGSADELWPCNPCFSQVAGSSNALHRSRCST